MSLPRQSRYRVRGDSRVSCGLRLSATGSPSWVSTAYDKARPDTAFVCICDTARVVAARIEAGPRTQQMTAALPYAAAKLAQARQIPSADRQSP